MTKTATETKMKNSQTTEPKKGYELEIGGIIFELRPETPVSVGVYVDGIRLPEMFSLHHQTNKRKLHPQGGPSDAQKEQYLRTVADYLTKNPEVLK